jgi:outer membrane immunogenic protein
MKKLLLVSSALVFAGPVFAADMPVRMPTKAPPPIAAVPYAWTGCYVGGHVGAGWDRSSFSDPGNLTPGLPPFVPASVTQTIAPLGSSIGVNSPAGVLGGVQAGCDYQFANHWVVGIGGDFAWSDIHGAAIDPFFTGKNGAPIPLSTRTDRIASVTGRLGYAWDNFLLYGKGGGAWAHDNYSIQNSNCLLLVTCSLAGSTDRTGWTAGVGLEWAFAKNWSAMVEYDHFGFGNKAVAFTGPNLGQNFIFNVRQDVDVVKVGVNYRFGLGGPVVARY